MFGENENEQGAQDPRYLRIDVEGKDKGKWAKFRQKLMDKLLNTLEDALDLEINPAEKNSLGDELKEFTGKGFSYLKAKLDAPGIENAKKLAEMEKAFAEKKKALAEARKTNAEAEKIEFETYLKKLKLKLTNIKVAARFIGGDGIVFTNHIDELLNAIKELEGTTDGDFPLIG